MMHLMQSRRKFFNQTAAVSGGLMAIPAMVSGSDVSDKRNVSGHSPIKPDNSQVWRNRQSGMHYRSLGRTGMMVSEIVLGTFPFDGKDSYPIFDASIARGVNYLDCASAYSNGKVELNVGNYLKESGNRERIFLATKLSSYYGMLDRLLLQEIDKRSPTFKKELESKAAKLIKARTVKRPGYHIQYFGSQGQQYDKAYYRYLAMQEVGLPDEWREKIKLNAHRLLEESLSRLQVAYVDVLHVPHGVAMPEMMDDLLKEIFAEFKQKGLIRASAVSFHNDVTGNLLKAEEVGYYDVAMFAYNIANHAGLEHAIRKANQSGMGLIAMKVAKLFSMKDQPTWRLEKLNAAISDPSLSPFAKSYLWALQNPNLSCCVSQMETVEELNDNLQVVGKKLNLPVI